MIVTRQLIARQSDTRVLCDQSKDYHSPATLAAVLDYLSEFGIPRKYQYQIGIWYFCPKFLGIFLVFYRCFEEALVKIW